MNIPRMTVDLYARRKKLLELYYAGTLTRGTLKGLAEMEGVADGTIRQDWYRREEWEPLVWMIDQSKHDVDGVLHSLQLARERAVALMRSADQDSVKVAAIGKLAEIASKEIELSQSLGLLPKMADKLEVEQTIKQNQELLWNELTEEEKNVFRMCASIRRAHSTEERSNRIH